MKPALEKYSVTIIAFILDIGRRKEAGNGQFLEKEDNSIQIERHGRKIGRDRDR